MKLVFLRRAGAREATVTITSGVASVILPINPTPEEAFAFNAALVRLTGHSQYDNEGYYTDTVAGVPVFGLDLPDDAVVAPSSEVVETIQTGNLNVVDVCQRVWADNSTNWFQEQVGEIMPQVIPHIEVNLFDTGPSFFYPYDANQPLDEQVAVAIVASGQGRNVTSMVSSVLGLTMIQAFCPSAENPRVFVGAVHPDRLGGVSPPVSIADLAARFDELRPSVVSAGLNYEDTAPFIVGGAMVEQDVPRRATPSQGVAAAAGLAAGFFVGRQYRAAE